MILLRAGVIPVVAAKEVTVKAPGEVAVQALGEVTAQAPLRQHSNVTALEAVHTKAVPNISCLVQSQDR